jgi:hypothetical protein
MPATDNLGPHLLGRKPSPPDPRDYRLEHFLTGDPLDAALAAVLSSWEGKKTKAWAQIITARVKSLSPTPPVPPDPGPSGPTGPAPAPTPPPPPVPTSIGWIDADDPVLDQGNTPRCVGFTGADWENALPVDDHVTNAAGDDIYAACKIVDGEPGQQNGSTIRSLAKVLQQRGRLKAYAFAAAIDDVWAFVSKSGPVCWGIGWTDSMFTPDASGLVVPSGPDVGGHAIIQYGVDGDDGLLLNHWGTLWGTNGKFRMHKTDLAERLANGGEAMAAVELP